VDLKMPDMIARYGNLLSSLVVFSKAPGRVLQNGLDISTSGCCFPPFCFGDFATKNFIIRKQGFISAITPMRRT
jgi:hypothetical protein